MQEKDQKQILRRFLNELSVVAPKMKIKVGMRNEVSGQFCVLKPSVFLQEASYFLVEKENAFWKNKNGENFYWCPERTDTINVLFVDDPKVEDVSSVFVTVQTSEKKKQYIFVLAEPISPERAQIVQKELVRKYQADVGASNIWHFRRLPGFLNWKYTEPFLITFEKHSNFLSLDGMPVITMVSESNDFLVRRFPKTTARKEKKEWKDFYTGDDSQTDMKYAVYLLGLGHTEEETFWKLKNQTPDLLKRKGERYADEYLRKTIQKASKYVSLPKYPSFSFEM